jgi:basic membrane protein A
VILVVIILIAGSGIYYYSTNATKKASTYKIVVVDSGGSTTSWADAVNSGVIQAVSYVESATGRNISVAYVYNVADADAQGVLSSYAESGYNLCIEAENTQDTASYAVAAQFPNFQIFGNSFGGDLAPNMGNWGNDVWRGYYPAGVIAGLMTKTDKIGFVGAVEYSASVEALNAFLAGAQLVNPKVTVSWAWTGDWHDSTKGASAAAGLISTGCDVLCGQGDGMTDGVVAECAKQGVYSIGYLYDENSLGPTTCLTSVLWNTTAYFVKGIQASMAGQLGYKSYSLGLYPDDISWLAPYHGLLPADKLAVANNYMAAIYNGTLVEPENTVLPYGATS